MKTWKIFAIVLFMVAFMGILNSTFAVEVPNEGGGGDTSVLGFISRYTDLTFGGKCAELNQKGVPDIKGVFCVIGKTINLLIGMAGAVAVAYLVYGGFLYMASGGDMKQLETARAAITYSIFGLLIILGSIFIIDTVMRSLGVF